MSAGVSFRIGDDWVAFVKDQVRVCRQLAGVGKRAAADALFDATMQATVEHVVRENPGRDAELRSFFRSLTFDSLAFSDPGELSR